jgi:Na+-transporting NADH:ubiquinone oxidoreductase subunit B
VQFLRNLIEKQRKLYHAKDSKFHKLWPLFDAFETFLFAPDQRATRARVHVRDYVDLKRIMNTVIIAMLPCLLWAIWNTGAQHFAAIGAMSAGGEVAMDQYTTGWLQSLLPGLFAPNAADPSAFDKVVFGLQRMLPLLIVSYGVGLGIEMAFCVIRKEEVSEGYLVSGMLIALIVPASIPLWQLAVGVAFAVILGKEVFGGTGMNIFNPAMMVRAFLFFAFAAQMSGDQVWVAGNQSPGGVPSHLIDGYSQPTALAVGIAFAVVLGKEVFGGTGMNIFNVALMVRAFLFFAFPAQMSGDTVWVAGNDALAGIPGNLIDGYSEPTALAVAKAAVVSGENASQAHAAWGDGAYSHANLFFGDMPGSAGEMSKLCVLLGAFWIVFTGVGSWRTMTGGLLGMLGAAFVVPMLAEAGGLIPDASLHLAPWEHLIAGGFLFGIVFMATDPVSSPETDRGKWIYGVLIGVVTVLVRMINPAYPEGTMLAILLLNAFAPTIDHFVVAANIKRRLARA